MAEEIVSEYKKIIPVCIVRPSIVTSAVAEPYPGWIVNLDGPTGVMLCVGIGFINNLLCDPKEIMDFIPVDIVSNTLIAAAWDTHRSYRPDQDVTVINCASGAVSSITWGEWKRGFLEWSRVNPFNNVMAYPRFTIRTNRMVGKWMSCLQHTLPAVLLDLIARMRGKRPTMLRTVQKTHLFEKHTEWVTLERWRFKVDNMKELIRRVNDSGGGQEFNCDLSRLNWSEYIRDYMLGIRRYLLGEGDETMEAARKRVRR